MVEFKSNTVMAHIFRINLGNIEYLLLKRSENEILYPNVWQCLTGTSENNELAVHTVKRELLEETSINYEKFFNLPYISNFFIPRLNKVSFAPCFAFKVDLKENVVLSEEHSEYIWTDLSQALKYLVIPSHKESVILLDELIQNGKLFELFEIKY